MHLITPPVTSAATTVQADHVGPQLQARQVDACQVDSRHPAAGKRPAAASDLRVVVTDEDGSLVTEYGLLAVVAATVAGVVIQWASGGALVTLFNALLRHARELVGA